MRISRFPQFRDKEWLRQKYEVEKLSSVQIAKIVGSKTPTATSAIKRAGIKLRNVIEAAGIRQKKGFKSEQLRDKGWLRQKYIDEKLNSYEIAELAETNQHSVMCALKEYGIETRNTSEAKTLSIEKNPIQSKYQELNDRDWLYQKYIEEKLSSPKIGRIIGCDDGLVRMALLKYEIPIRSNEEAHEYFEYKSHLYERLNDRDWLQEQYVAKGLSINEIADIVGVQTSNSVRQSLIRYDIPVRSISDGLTFGREEDNLVLNMPVLEGNLLGDASLGTYNRKSELSYPYFHKKNKFQDHINFVAKKLFSKSWEKRVKPEWVKKYNRFYHTMRSLSHKELKPIYRDWYPESNNFKKLVPRNIELTPETLLHWFMDDGYSCYRKLKTKVSSYIGFCSESFSKEDNEFLIEQMKNNFNLSVTLRKTKSGTGWRIHLWHESVLDFLEIIGPPPVASLAYKWKKIE